MTWRPRAEAPSGSRCVLMARARLLATVAGVFGLRASPRRRLPRGTQHQQQLSPLHLLLSPAVEEQRRERGHTMQHLRQWTTQRGRVACLSLLLQASRNPLITAPPRPHRAPPLRLVGRAPPAHFRSTLRLCTPPPARQALTPTSTSALPATSGKLPPPFTRTQRSTMRRGCCCC